MNPSNENLFTVHFNCFFFLTSCAGSYTPMNSGGVEYGALLESEGLRYSYRYNILSENGNKKYANKELKKGIKLVGVELENTTDRPIVYKNNVDMFVGENLTLPMESQSFFQQVKQPSGLYMLWSLLWVFFTRCDGNDCNTTPIPLGLLIGIGNTAGASGANTSLEADLAANYLLNKTIQPGETVRGFIAFNSQISGPLIFKLR